MRQAIIEIEPNRFIERITGKLFNRVKRIEGREILRLDYEKGVKLVIADIVLKDGYDLEDIELPSGAEILLPLKEEGKRHTVMIRVKVPSGRLMKMFQMFNLDVIYTLPYHSSKDSILLSCMGESGELNKFIKLAGILGNVRNVSFTKVSLDDVNLLGVLTEKQRDVLIRAKREGYYEYPRRIDTGKLSEKLGISKATTVEHLRKAEIRLISRILEGY